MPTLPFYTGQPVNAVPSTIDTGTALVTQAKQPTEGDRALLGAATQIYQAREALKRSEQQQHVTSRALALQNQLKAAELEAASTTGTADDYLTKVRESSDMLFANAYEGLNAEQSRALAPKIEALQAAHGFSVTQRELYKRTDSGRAALLAQEREALAVFRNPDASPYDRAIAQSNYFEGLDEAAMSGLYAASDVETIKTTFASSAAEMDMKAAEDAYVAHYAKALMDQYSDPRQRLKAIDALPGTDAQRQALRDEVEDRTSRDERYRNQDESDIAGQVLADIMVDPSKFTSRGLANDPRVPGRYRDDLVKLYKTVRDEGVAAKDDPAVVGTIFAKIRDMSPEQLATHNFIPEYYAAGSKELAVTPKTISLISSLQSQARSGAVSEMRRTMQESWSDGVSFAKNRGHRGKELESFAAMYSAAVLNMDEPPRDPVAQRALADQVERELEIDMPMSPVDLEEPVFRMSPEELNDTIEYGDLEEGWPDFFYETVNNAMVRRIMNEDPSVDFEGALQRVMDIKKSTPKVYREEAKKYLAPYLKAADQ